MKILLSKKIFISTLAIVTVGFGATYAINTVLEGYRANSGTTVTIDATSVGGDCRSVVTPADGKDRFIPTKTVAEWNSFKSAATGLGMSLNSCTYNITNSLLFDSGNSQYLSRTLGVAGNQKKWTWSGWMKFSKIGEGNVNLFGGGTAGSNWGGIEWSADTFYIRDYNGSSNDYVLTGAPLYRDPAAWYHVVVAFDDAQTTSTDRVKAWVNNTLVPLTGTWPIQNTNYRVNTPTEHRIGRYMGVAVNTLNGYVSDVNFVDSGALDPTAFGQTDPTTGLWVPKQFTGNYGTNGFHLDFSSGSALGSDSSGNGNNWTINGGMTAASNQVIDTPLNNFATLNVLTLSAGSLSFGNLRFTALTANSQTRLGTIGVFSGKWYWETNIGTVSVGTDVGIAPASVSTYSNGYYPGSDSSSYSYDQNGQKYTGNSSSAYGSTYTNGDVIGTALDMDTGTLTFYKNGISQGVAYSSLSGIFVPAIASYGNGNYFTVNFGQGGQSGLTYDAASGGRFKYAPPGGFKALSTANFPVPAIMKPNQYFDVLTWAGNDTARSITGLGFQPDLVWTKDRSVASSHRIHDSVRGGNGSLIYTLKTELTDAEGTDTLLSGFVPGGFSLLGGANHPNVSGRNFVAWNWKAGGAAVVNNAGTITSQVSANPTAGFSVVTYTGNGTAGATIGHGLGVTPKFIIARPRNTSQDWAVYHASQATIPQNNTLYLNLTNATIADPNMWNNTAPTSTVFSVGTSGTNNQNTASQLAYVFAEVPGYSKFGSYTGNGSADGSFVYTGFKPKFVLTKRVDGGAEHWNMFDGNRSGYNPANYLLYSNLTNGDDSTLGRIDLLSNGFKARDAGSGYNAAGATYIYAAFADTGIIPIVAPNTSPNIPVFVSATATNPTTLSATYSDPNNGDSGWTNYRLATSATGCLDNSTTIGWGTIGQTPNTTATTWTSSSVSAGTYYWCAQNDDGLLQSAWASMGSVNVPVSDGLVVDGEGYKLIARGPTTARMSVVGTSDFGIIDETKWALIRSGLTVGFKVKYGSNTHYMPKANYICHNPFPGSLVTTACASMTMLMWDEPGCTCTGSDYTIISPNYGGYIAFYDLSPSAHFVPAIPGGYTDYSAGVGEVWVK